jgi:hypothetical protein
VVARGVGSFVRLVDCNTGEGPGPQEQEGAVIVREDGIAAAIGVGKE